MGVLQARVLWGYALTWGDWRLAAEFSAESGELGELSLGTRRLGSVILHPFYR